jgi:arginase family enzyme
MGTMAGHLAANPEAVVIWVDAHADINTISRYSTTLLI